MKARRRFAEQQQNISEIVDQEDDKKYDNQYRNNKQFLFPQTFASIIGEVTNITNFYLFDRDKETKTCTLSTSVSKEDFIMASRDRTVEFGNAVRSLQSKNVTRYLNQHDTRKIKDMQSYSEFMNMAKFIGKNLTSTYAKLEKLTLLAKKKSLFEDRPQEIQELTYIIKGDLGALNEQIAKLQNIFKNNESRSRHMNSHSSNMVLALQSKLAAMSTDFKQILQIRTENLKIQKNRHDQFSQESCNSNSGTNNTNTSLLLAEEANYSSIVIEQSSGQHMNQTQLNISSKECDHYVQQRAETMQNIESTIVELGGIFQQLAYMVKEQEEIVERIDTNITDAEMNIDAAHSEILKYFQSVTKNRWLMIKIFGVLIFFFIFFAVFMS